MAEVKLLRFEIKITSNASRLIRKTVVLINFDISEAAISECPQMVSYVPVKRKNEEDNRTWVAAAQYWSQTRHSWR
jgi:hypothetical protein